MYWSQMYFIMAWLSNKTYYPYFMNGIVWFGLIFVNFSDKFSDFRMSIIFSSNSILPINNKALTALDGAERGWVYNIIYSILGY